MPTILQHRRGTTTCAAASTLCSGELFVDCDTNRLYLHNGATTGGSLIAGSDNKNNVVVGAGSLGSNCSGNKQVVVAYQSLSKSIGSAGSVAVGSCVLEVNAGCTTEVIESANFGGCNPPVGPALGTYICAGTGLGYSVTSCYCGTMPLCHLSGTTPTCIPTAQIYFDGGGNAQFYGINAGPTSSTPTAGFGADTILTINAALAPIMGSCAAQIPAPAKGVHNSVAIGQNVFRCLNDAQGLVAIGLNIAPNMTCNSSRSVVIGNGVGLCSPGCASFQNSVIIGNDAACCWDRTPGSMKSSYSPVIIGSQAAWKNGGGLTIIGTEAGTRNACGDNNTIIGSAAVINPNAGCWSTCMTPAGFSSGLTAVGYTSLYNGGDYSTAIGFQSGFYSNNNYQNTFLGACAGAAPGVPAPSIFCGGCNNTFVGYQAARMAAQCYNNSIVLGNASVEGIYAAVTSITSLSDCRDKTNITNLPIGLDFVKKLNPVKFDWQTRDGSKEGQKDFGFVAQSVAAVEDEYSSAEWTDLVERDEGGYQIRMTRFVPLLVKAIQDLSAENDSLKTRVQALENK